MDASPARTSRLKHDEALNTTYPPGASHLETIGLMCLRGVCPVVSRLGPLEQPASLFSRVYMKKELESCRPVVLLDTLREQWAQIGQLDEQTVEIERCLRAWHKKEKASCRIAGIPGVGLLTAIAAVVALAKKMARAIWALLAHEREYHKGYVSQPA
jgi:hypothetical protein